MPTQPPLSTLGAAAVDYVRHGWAITPLYWMQDGHCACGNPGRDPYHDYKQGGKHPIYRKWQLEPISTVEAAISAWTRTPEANIGGLTGAASGMWALDYDPENGGKLDDIPATNSCAKVHQTGSGGRHFIYTTSDYFCPSNSRGSLPQGWDVRGSGGQIVLPPSVSGKGVYLAIKNSYPRRAPGEIEALIRTRKNGDPYAAPCDFCPIANRCNPLIACKRGIGSGSIPSLLRVSLSLGTRQPGKRPTGRT